MKLPFINKYIFEPRKSPIKKKESYIYIYRNYVHNIFTTNYKWLVVIALLV